MWFILKLLILIIIGHIFLGFFETLERLLPALSALLLLYPAIIEQAQKLYVNVF